MKKTNITLLALLSFCLGIALHTVLPYNPDWYLVASIWSLGGIVIIYLAKYFHISPPKIPKLIKLPKLLTILLLMLSAFSLGTYRGQSTIHISSSSTVDYYTSEERNSVTIVGTIAEEPDVRRDKINYTIRVSDIKISDSENPKLKTQNSKKEIENWNEVTGYTLISTGKYPPYYYGDQLEITGHLQKPAIFDTFDYAGYLSRYNIYSVMYRPRVKLLQNPSEALTSPPSPDIDSPLPRGDVKQSEDREVWARENQNFLSLSNIKQQAFILLLKIKSSFEKHMNLTFSTEPSSSFMAGLLLGSRKGIPEKLSEDFRITGLTHIIAISGYNITLVVTILMALFKPFGKKPSILISATGVILFTIFAGASPAVVRACIMGIIALMALNSERKGNITLALIITATLMIGYNPKILVYDIGFQLSFLATMGLIYVSPLLEPYFQWLPEKLAIRESILLCLSAQIMALPVILLNFQNLSLISPISNLLIAGPIIPLAMLFGFISTMISFLFLPFAKLIAYPAYLLLEYIVQITQFTANIPYASLEITWFSQPILLVYFASLTIYLLHTWSKINQRKKRITTYQLQYQQLILQIQLSR